MAFHVGQAVVCINDKWRCARSVVTSKLHQRYAVREICLGVDNREGLRLVEVTNVLCGRMIEGKWEECEPHFWSDHFRPLQTTSISDLLSQEAPKDSTAWDNRKHLLVKERA